MNYATTLFHLNDASVLEATILKEYTDAYKVLIQETGIMRHIRKGDIIRLNDDFLRLKRVQTHLRRSKHGLEVIINSMKGK